MLKNPFCPFILGFALISTAPAKAAPKLDAADQRVIQKLQSVLQERVKTASGGEIPFKIVPTERASEGYFSEISVQSKNARLRRLYVSDVALRATNVQIDVPTLMRDGKVRTKKSTTQMRAVISEKDLTKMLSQGKHTKSMNLKVRFLSDKMFVTGNLNYSLINGPVQGTAKLRRAGDKVFLDILSMKLRGAEIPNFLKNQFSSHINPIIDIGDLPFEPRFKTVKIVGDKAILTT